MLKNMVARFKLDNRHSEDRLRISGSGGSRLSRGDLPQERAAVGNSKGWDDSDTRGNYDRRPMKEVEDLDPDDDFDRF